MKQRWIALFAATMLFATMAAGQNHRGGGGMMGPGTGAGSGSSMGRGNGPGDMNGAGGPFIVAPDGTLFLTTRTYDAATNTASLQIKAVNAAGAVVWTKTLTDTRGHLVLSGANLLVVDNDRDSGDSTITAFVAATGATAWTKTFDGHVGHLEPFSGGTYAFVIVPPSTQGGTATRTLVALSNAGAVLWTLTL